MALIYLFISIDKTQDELNSNLESIFIKQAKRFSNNLDKELKYHIKKDIYKTLSKNRTLRETIEHSMSVMIGSSYKYIYVLYRDKSGNYRYLLDGSKKDKGEFNQKLNVNKKKWDKVYEMGKEGFLDQSDLENLWITYLKPVIISDRVEAVIAIDFSMKLPKNISDAIQPLHHTFYYIFLTIGIMLLILLYQSMLNIKTKKDSVTDPLTNAYNRNYLRDLLLKINIQNYQIMMLDIDHFKKVNDSYGHKAGDFVLYKTATIIKEEIRDRDILIRFGGEEFLVFIYRDSENMLLAKKIAERLRLRISNQIFNYEDSSMKVTISTGISCSPERFKSVSSAIKYADEMLYIAKNHGRNRVVTMPIKKDYNQAVDIKSIHEFKEALEDNRVTCYFQPIFRLQDRKVIKYEALVRMIEKSGEVVLPASFLENVMRTNIYRDMTKQVLNIVFKKIKEKEITISINLNFSDILDNDIYELIVLEIERNSSLASWLVVELLEYEMIEQMDLIKERLLKIKSYGVKIAVDDFGSGYSNYTVFQTLPIDILKIDGSLIKNIKESEISKKITKSIVLLTKELGIETVAEFVHSEDVLEVIQSLEVTEGQGFYLGKPEAII